MTTYSIIRIVLPAFALAVANFAQAEVPTQRVEARAVGLTHPAEATLEAVRQATLAAQVPGRIVEFRVDAGDHVAKGQVLLRIDAAEASQAVAGAEAGIAQAQANQINAKAAYERTKSLVERKFVSQSALDQAKASYDAAEAQLRAARAGRGQAATVQGYTTIVAPLSGLVAARHVEPGEMAQPGRQLVTVYDPAAMRAVVDVPQQRFAGVGSARIRARVELPDSERWLDAASVTVLPAADPRTHTVRVRVDLPANAEGLVPGTFARVHFVTGEGSRIAVPAGAILRRGELTGVYVADGKGGFALRQIRAGEALADGSIEVLAGLAGGEEVALDPVQAGIVAHAARNGAAR
ncbi:efflux RND transporter periplasmic adaptor subunit [Aromatoleum toluvorans]|uniref:Efflux RND transporter periplasmic adaptor subunit n=1 Tax=Aromatoleum toluvorans TaxID=92002 RepID=A0ABX1Q3G4_9RHOO|nr:efflux RND transporter periplasmic adaptor subunit [Aromatoleum toluvorans]NMG45342.1 efflux RND transporter periplasmic adaptor subunit [Aromatoleum toluvorans]